jgi:predicted dehydrogenase
MREWRVVGTSFEHMHMGDLLREVHEHANAEIAGVCDQSEARMAEAIANFAISPERVFANVAQCVRGARPDLAILCPATARHADVVEEVAALGVDILIEKKPFAASLADSDRILAAVEKSGVRLAVNWPLRWYPPHVTMKRLIDEGLIGDPIEVHFYDGNRGPLYHRADKVVVSDEEVSREKPTLWWYSKVAGGGSLLDYLGYRATLGTWFMNGEAPVEMTAVVDEPPGLEIDEHSITVCRYARGLSKLETRWGTSPIPGPSSCSPSAALLSWVRKARFRVAITTCMSACRPALIRPSARLPWTNSRRRSAGRSNTCSIARSTGSNSRGRSIPRSAAPRSASSTPLRSRPKSGVPWRCCRKGRPRRLVTGW